MTTIKYATLSRKKNLLPLKALPTTKEDTANDERCVISLMQAVNTKRALLTEMVIVASVLKY